MLDVFAEFSLLLLLSAIVGMVALLLRQPVLIAYIALGLIVGPAGLHLVSAHDQIDLLAQIGVTVLLFIVGLKLDWQHVRHIGPVALATGLGQLFFTIVIGFLILLALDKSWVEALYVAVALTFSSTIIIVKLLSDKRELDSLHGRIAVGFLIVQDLAVVAAMMVMSALRGAPEGGDWGTLLAVAVSLSLRLLAAAVSFFVLMRFVLPRLVAQMARSQELLLIFAVAWGTALATLGEWAGFSKEAGAFLAGFSLASTPFRDAINARLAGIRDFLLLFFFLDLGARMDLSTLQGELGSAVVLSLFVLIGNPLIVMAIMGYMGYRKRTGFLCGLTVAQISEFSIIFVAMGIALGHVDESALGLTTLVGLVTIALSTYMILYSHQLYEKLAPYLGWFERKHPRREEAMERLGHSNTDAEVIVFGMGRLGHLIARRLQEQGVRVLGVDFDPEVIRSERRAHIPVRFGDALAAEFLETLPLANARWVISTLPDPTSNRLLLQQLRALHYEGPIGVVVREELTREQMHAFVEAGATQVWNPLREAAEFTAEMIVSLLRGAVATSNQSP